MHLKQFFPFKYKIFLWIFTFMTIPIIFLTFFSNQISTYSLLDQTRIDDIQTIHSLQTSMDIFLDSFEGLGALIASDPEVISRLDSSNSQSPNVLINQNHSDLLSHYLNYSDSLLGISLVNQNYYFLGHQPFDRYQLAYCFNQTLFKEIKQNSPFWTKPHILRQNNSDQTLYSISCVTPVYRNNETLGYVILYIDRNQMDSFLQNLTDTVYIINDNPDGSFVVSAKSEFLSDSYSKPSLYSMTKINYNYLTSDSSVITTLNNKKVTITTQKYSRMDWLYLIVSAYSEIDSRILSRISNIFVICIGAIFFAILSSLLISRTITRPIHNLEHTMKQVGDGNLLIRHTQITNDEIGKLATNFNLLLDKIQTLMKNIEEQQRNKRKLQLQLIQAQVNPHFLYNVLEMISSFIRENQSSYALNSIAHLANFYRISLSNGVNIISIKKETQLLENYLSLQQLRYIEFMDFAIEIPHEIESYPIPKLTLQPIVENSIYHGLKIRCTKGILKIHGYLEKERIYLEIYDDGVGMDSQTISSIMDSLQEEDISKDFGISSVMKRLNIYYNNEATITIESQPKIFTRVTISFPAKPVFNQ